MERPNIIYIHSHDTGRYIQPYGHAVATPNLQRLAEEGVLFRQNFCANPTCCPSRACLLTGTYAHCNGMLGLVNEGFSMPDYSWHVLHTLRKKGYISTLAGHQHIAAPRGGQEAWQIIGYDTCLQDDVGAHNQAAAFLDGLPKQPFFLTVGLTETHRTFPPLAEVVDDPRYTMPPAPLPDTPETRQDMARFKASARILDRKMGVVFDSLRSTGLAENTLVICTTDHGIAFPRMKCNLHDSGTGVMLIMRGPGGFTGGKVIDAMTSHIDIFPTICDLCGIDYPDWLRGTSLLPLIRQEKSEIHKEIFAEVNFHGAYEPMRSIRTRRWKYIKRYDGRTKPVMPNCDPSESKTLWVDNGWPDLPQPADMLYDLIFDPNETNNLIGNPGMEAVLANLRARLDKWMRDTNDPLLEGPLELPPGARVDDPDDM